MPVVVGGVKLFGISRPCSGLFPAMELDEVEVILHTDTAFLRYFRSRRVVPLVIPTS